MAFEERQSPVRQETVTVLARVEREPELAAALASLQPGVFADPALGVHFARLAVIPRDEVHAGSHVWLVFESNFDTPVPDAEGARDAHFAVLAERLYGPLTGLF